ncbi:hypothetical protein SAMN04487886_10258 [Clostridium sp. DSM 8431]|uniref:hypothetical protein n=1 Tax=Clostridium sp. DSM 8431 TaxID=1761781 RepID=UPI0008EE5776|nr:hypothetical protein [Clostridium sp. DSM 8431]SFU42693.1 hypothetical protein SAMN04487886_10258 [Clostridium sp. DSM 8431]
MRCIYCGEDKKASREHIISSSVLDLFPECFITIDNSRGNAYMSDPVIKDVCEDCNNKVISYIDTYAKKIISKYFIQKYKKDDVINFNYDYTLLQKMLLKFAFNDLRSRKDDISFFDKNKLDFLMNESRRESLRNITILAGIAVNTSPVPDYIFGNNKIRWSKNPALLSNSIIQNIDYCTGQIRSREGMELQKFKKMNFSYLFRFNSGQFILICWDDNILDEELKNNNIILENQYPYTILTNKNNSTISRCTSEITYHSENLIDVVWGQELFDQISYMRGTFSEKSQEAMRSIERLWEEEKKLAEEHPRK